MWVLGNLSRWSQAIMRTVWRPRGLSWPWVYRCGGEGCGAVNDPTLVPGDYLFDWVLVQSMCGGRLCELQYRDEAAGVSRLSFTSRGGIRSEFYLDGCKKPFLSELELYDAWMKRDQERWVRVDEHGLRIVEGNRDA